MTPSYETDLYRRLHAEVNKIPIIDSHEHLQRESELPVGENIHIGRFFIHYANSDLRSAGMPLDDLERVVENPALTPKERFKLVEPWYRKAWNTGYCETIRLAMRDLYDIEDLSLECVDDLTARMRAAIRPGYTRQVFDRANIDYALDDPFGPKLVFNPDFNANCTISVMKDDLSGLPIAQLSREAGMEIGCLDDYLKLIDWYFAAYAQSACSFKVVRAYERSLYWEDVAKSAVEGTFNRMLAMNDTPDRKAIQALEDFVFHYLCRKCGHYGLRMQIHTGLHEGNGNNITNSRAALMTNLFMKYPRTHFDLFHISYPYQEELLTLAKNFENVTIDFCWMWIINPAAGRRALSDMLDAVPANKIHGFGGDFIFVEGSYAHAAIARREITRVLCEKVEEGRFSEAYALQVAQMLLRDNAIENFDLVQRREKFKKIAGERI
jgi:uncharacterized protein